MDFNSESIQKVQIKNSELEWIKLYQGVTQEIVLGPLLFSPYSYVNQSSQKKNKMKEKLNFQYCSLQIQRILNLSKIIFNSDSKNNDMKTWVYRAMDIKAYVSCDLSN